MSPTATFPPLLLHYPFPMRAFITPLSATVTARGMVLLGIYLGGHVILARLLDHDACALCIGVAPEIS